jgi:hypothetical protein
MNYLNGMVIQPNQNEHYLAERCQRLNRQAVNNFLLEIFYQRQSEDGLQAVTVAYCCGYHQQVIHVDSLSRLSVPCPWHPLRAWHQGRVPG